MMTAWVVAISLFTFISMFVPYAMIQPVKGLFVQIVLHLYYVTYSALNTVEIALNFVSFVVALGKGCCDVHPKMVNTHFICRRIT